MEVPREIDGASVVRFAVLAGTRPTGRTEHTVNGRVAGPFEALAIVHYPDDPPTAGFYLFYLDASWRNVTDTWHQTVEGAMRQAEFEYEGVTPAWMDQDNPSRHS